MPVDDHHKQKLGRATTQAVLATAAKLIKKGERQKLI